MKKFLSVMLVLALCGIANAAFDIYLTDAEGNSDISMMGSDTIELIVWYTGVSEVDGTLIQQFDVEADVTSGPGTILGGAIVATGRNTAYDGVVMPGFSGKDIELVGGRDDSLAITAGMANPLATVSFHCDGPGDVVIDLYDVMTYDQSWNLCLPTYHGMTITQIPEPATIALLCLGGLLIRKK